MPKAGQLKKPAKKVGKDRSVIYPKPLAKVLMGDDALTAEQAKDLLGWEKCKESKTTKDKEGKETKEETVYRDISGKELIKYVDRNGDEFVMHNNLSNRPFDYKWSEVLMYEILKGRWRLNAMNMVIGKTGITISCQHRLAALVFASQEYKNDPEAYPFWESEPTIETFIAYGIDESDDTVNTQDTNKPRTRAEVIYRSVYFEDMANTDRLACAKTADWAIRMLLTRTGCKNDALMSNRVHSESLDFLARHDRILKAVRILYDMDSEGKISNFYVSTGYASACLYLMACSSSDPSTYNSSEVKSEELLDFENWDKAVEFFKSLASGSKKFVNVKETISQLMQEERDANNYRIAILAKAWNLFLSGKPMSPESLQLEFREDAGIWEFVENPTFGGIDIGLSQHTDDADDPTQEEIDKRKKAVRTTNGKKKRDLPKVGQKIWADDEGGHVEGVCSDIYEGPNGKVIKLKTKSGKEWEYTPDDVSTVDPNDEGDEE